MKKSEHGGSDDMLFRLRKASLYSALILFVGLMPSITAADVKTVEPIDLTEQQGQLLLLDCSKEPLESFRYNNWKGKITCEWSKDKTPSSSPAYHLKLDEQEEGVVHINLFIAPGGSWRTKDYDSLSFWIKGDGSGIMIRISLGCGKGYIYHHRLNSKKWERVSVPLDKLWHRKGVEAIDISKLTLFSISVSDTCSFSIGEVALELGAKLLSLRERRLMVIPEAEGSLILDGNLKEEFWKRSCKTSGFKKLGSSTLLPKLDTDVYSAYGKQNLYIAARLHYEDTSRIKTIFTKRDERVYQEDDFEVIIDTNNDYNTYHHFAMSTTGVIWDMKRYYDIDACLYTRSIKWNSNMRVKTKRLPKSIDMELSIPFSDLEITSGEVTYMGLQLGRTNRTDGEYSCWSPTGKFPMPSHFGVMVFGRKQPFKVKLEDIQLREIKVGRYRLTGDLVNPGGTREVTLKVTATGPHQDKHNFEESFSLTSKVTPFSMSMDIDSISEGEYNLGLVVEEGENVTPCVKVMAFDVVVPLDIEFGKVTLSPEPKEIEWKKGRLDLDERFSILVPRGASERTKKTARFFQEELIDHTGIKLPIKEWNKKDPLDKTILLLARRNLQSTFRKQAERLQRLNGESYILDIEKKHALLLGNDEPGLYYAVVTFMQILRAPKVRIKEKGIPCVSILDWPNLDLRCNYYYFAGASRRKKDVAYFNTHPKEKMRFLKDYIKRYVAGNKLNQLNMTLENAFKWERHPELRYGAIIDADELKELAEYAREHFVEFVPGINIAGHNPFFIVRSHPELRVPDYKHMPDMTNPKYLKILYDCLDEMIDACQPNFIDIGHDELWHRVSGDKQPLTHRNGIPRKEIFYQDIMNHYNYLKKRGIKMCMYGDMILRDHHGNRFNCWEVAERLPKDIIINNWSAAGCRKSSRELKDIGFEVVCDMLNGFTPTPYDRGIIQGFGSITYGPFIHTTQGFTTDKHGVAFCFHGLIRAADYAWNYEVDKQTPIAEWRRQKLLNLLPVLGYQPNRYTTRDFVPIDISKTANETMTDRKPKDGKGWFDLGPARALYSLGKDTKEIGLIPVKIAAKENGQNIILLRPNDKPVEIAVGNKYSSLIFLHTCYYPDSPKEKKRTFRGRATGYFLGIPIGSYHVVYEDDTEEEVLIRYGRNILEWIPYPHARFLPMCRYVWETKLRTGQLGCLYQYEWVNPNRHKTIVKIIVQRANTEADIALICITGRGVKKSE